MQFHFGRYILILGNTRIVFFFIVSLELSEEDNKEESKYVPQITPDGRIPDQWYPELAYAVDKAVLIEVEELEEKVFSASLQTKVFS